MWLCVVTTRSAYPYFVLMIIRRSALSHFTSDIRKEIADFARNLSKEHRGLFTSDPTLRKRAGQFLTALLPPKPKRRGRPGIQSVTIAIRLRHRLKRQFPSERPAKLWEWIYPKAIPGYSRLSELEQGDARQQLRERVRWRQRDRKRHKALEGIVSKPAPAPQAQKATGNRATNMLHPFTSN